MSRSRAAVTRLALVRSGRVGDVITVGKPGDIIEGRYQLVQLIGRGSMAEVFAARDTVAERDVAIKLMRRRLVGNSEAKRRIEREAKVQQMIEHRNVAAYYAAGATKNGTQYLVLELLRGKTLRHVIKVSAPVDPVRAASYAFQTLEGLDATHAIGILHRDLKPANLMLEPSPGPVERVVLIDFGFAKFEGAKRLTAQGHVVGSLAYLSPERLTGRKAEERSDLYAVGVILYELLAGVRPFQAEGDVALINQHLNDQPPPFATSAPEVTVPAAIGEVVMRALAKRPDERYRSAREMADALQAASQTI